MRWCKYTLKNSKGYRHTWGQQVRSMMGTAVEGPDFEKTISFSPFASDGPPLYKDDCLPDPPVFSNPFAWDGKSARAQVQAQPIEKPDPQALEDCLKQLPQDSIEAESARDRRLLEQWDFDRLGR